MDFNNAGKIADKAMSNPLRFIISGMLIIIATMSGYAINLSVRLSNCADEKDNIISRQNDALQKRIDMMLDQKLQAAVPQIEQKQDILKSKTDSLKKKTDSVVSLINKMQ